MSQNPQPYAPGIINSLLAGLAGYDLHLLPNYAGPLVGHEHKKLVRVGSSVLIPSFFGFFTSYYLLGKYLHSPALLWFSAIAFALLLLVVDSIIVTTLSKTKGFGWFVRIAMSLCIGLVVSEPALLALYQKTINARIEAALNIERTGAETTLKAKLAEAKKNLSAIEGKLATQRDTLAGYSDQNIAKARYLEVESRKKELLGKLAQSKELRSTEEMGLLEKLQAQRNNKSGEIEAKMLAMNVEESGMGVSGKSGRGSFWHKLKGELATLKAEAADLGKQIADAHSRISKIQTDRAEENQVNAQFKGPYAIGPASGPLLTDDERMEKTRLQAEVKELTSEQTLYRQLVGDLEKELAGLTVKYALSNRDDSLAQTQVLYQIAAENPVLLVKVCALFLLIFFIDTVPTLVKLTVQTGYDDYLKALSQQKLQASLADNLAYDQECANAAIEKINKLNQCARHLTDSLNATNAVSRRYPHERVLHDEAYRSMKLLARQLAQLEYPSPSFSMWRWLSSLPTAIKTKFRL